MDSHAPVPQVGETRPQLGERRIDITRDVVLTLQSLNEEGVVEYTREGMFRGPIPGMDVPCVYAGFTHLNLWLSWPLVEGKGEVSA